MVNELVSILFESQLQSHIFHLNTSSYAKHIALGEYYEEIEDLIDNLAETAIGVHGKRLDYYKKYSVENEEKYIIPYFIALRSKVLTHYKENEMFQDPSLQSIIEQIIELINKTVYKLQQLS